MDRCDACEFVYDEVPSGAIPAALRALAATYGERLVPPAPDVGHDLRLREHPVSGVWSALEYACHVRDVLRVQQERIQRALSEDRPQFEPMGREDLVERERYNEQDPHAVAREIALAADALASDLESLEPAGWRRTGGYNWPTVEQRDVTWIARHTVHELEHHLRDLDQVLGTAR